MMDLNKLMYELIGQHNVQLNVVLLENASLKQKISELEAQVLKTAPVVEPEKKSRTKG
jgi:hypothetical protein